MVPAQLPGNEVTAAVPEEEADGLQHSHQGEDNANGGGGTVALKHAYEKGIRHIIESGYKHADDTGQGQVADQPPHRRLGHLLKLLLLFFFHRRRLSSFNEFLASL